MGERRDILVQILQSIDARLEDILNVLKLGQRNSLEEAKIGALGDSPLRTTIYKLCDGEHTVSEISHLTGKSISQVSQVLSQLQLAGLVTEKREGKNRYYQTIF